jgi:hypothetical protein
VRGLAGVTLLEPAHVSLGYPWVRDAATRVGEVLTAASATAAGEIELRGPALFEQDVRRRTVVHAELSDDAVPRALAAALGASLRTAHLSIARVGRVGDLEQVLAAVSHLLPLTVRLDVLELTVKTDEGWKTLLRAPLG